MIARMRRSLREDEGFTLVELLVVIIIIGILSAVAVPVYLNQQKKAKDTAANSDVSTLGKEIQTALIDASDASNIKFKVDSATSHYMLATDGATFSTDVGRVSDGVKLVDPTTGSAVADGTTVAVSALGGGAATSTDWCISVNHSGGTNMNYRYSNTGGIESDKTCKES